MIAEEDHSQLNSEDQTSYMHQASMLGVGRANSTIGSVMSRKSYAPGGTGGDSSGRFFPPAHR